MMLLLSSAPALSSLAIVLAAAAGLVGAIVTLLKLRPEANQSAVIQAQGAMETMEQLNEALEKALERANTRGDLYRERMFEIQARYDALQDRYDRAVAQWGPFPDDVADRA
jgi:uncharacterized protein HemX